MPKYGNITNPSKDILKEIKTIGDLGFDYVEIGIEGPEGMPDILIKKKKQIIRLLKKYNMFVIGHCAYYVNLGSAYESVRKGWLKESKKSIRAAYELGIKKIVFHSHSKGMFISSKKSKKTILKNYILSLKELVRYGKKFNIQIMFENATERGEITELKDFKYIVDRVSNLKVLLDIGHAFINGGMKNIQNYIKSFKNKLEHIHMSDNHGQHDEHLSLGSGLIDYKKVIRLLKKIKYDKTITFEIFTKDRDLAQNSMLKIKKLWK